MKGNRISTWRDLEKYGFDLLTGESCGMGMRLLVDISPQAVEIVEEFLSINLVDDNSSWNHEGQDGWKSIMMPRGLLPELAAFCLFMDGCKYVVHVSWRVTDTSANYIEGFRTDDEFKDFKQMANKLYGDHWRVWWASGTTGLRNRHYMSGRVA